MSAELIAECEAAAKDFIAECDANGDGVIEWSEIEGKFGADWSPEERTERQAAYKEMDINGDGKVDKEEFVKWMVGVMTKESAQ